MSENDKKEDLKDNSEKSINDNGIINNNKSI